MGNITIICNIKCKNTAKCKLKPWGVKEQGIDQQICAVIPLLQDIGSDLRSKRSLISDSEQNLRLAKSSCDNMATKFQEHCPDIERQEADVQKLNKRLNNLNRQIDTR